MTEFQRGVATALLIHLSQGKRGSLRKIARDLGCSVYSLRIAFAALEDLGYIERPTREWHLVRVRVSMVPASGVAFRRSDRSERSAFAA